MRGDTTSGGARFREHEEPGDAERPPAASGSQLRCESHLSVERREHPADVWYHGLDLDHEQRPRYRIEREDVDRASLAEHVEGHLGREGPAIREEPSDHRLDERRVVAVAKPI